VARVSAPATGTVNGAALANGVLPTIRVLIADDSSLFRDGLSNLVSTQKDLHVAGTVDSAATANEQIRLLRPDVVLLGWSASAPASQRIFAAIQDSKMPTRIIMMVSDDGKEDFVEAIRLGCSGIVPKTTSTELLLKSIRKVHAGEYWMDRVTTADVIRRLAKKRPAGNAPSSRLGVRDQSTALSTREREIVILVAQGFKNKEMAERMFISEQTVKNHLHNIFDKLGVSDRLELALYAIHHNLHEPS
jgi:two-component system nitrate/nitrite response regulator NarL